MGNRTTDWTNALTSGKGGPDITELGNTDTPGVATQGALANITSDVKSWSSGSDIIAGNLANDTVSGQNYAVPWFGGVRGIWYNKNQFAKALHLGTPHHLGAAGQRRQGTDACLPGYLRAGRTEQLHQRDRQLHLGRRRPGSRTVRRPVEGRTELPAVRGRHKA